MSWKEGSAMGETGLNFGVLGPLQLSVHGTLVPLGPPKQRAVLAMLVINRNRPVGVESLINAVWGQSPVPADGVHRAEPLLQSPTEKAGNNFAVLIGCHSLHRLSRPDLESGQSLVT
jgi:hypothetical protein